MVLLFVGLLWIPGVHWDCLGEWNWGGTYSIAVCPGLTFPGGFGGHLSECGMHWIILPWARLDTTFVLN